MALQHTLVALEDIVLTNIHQQYQVIKIHKAFKDILQE